MYQHYRYFEYYEKDYKLQDKSYVKTLNSFELRADELNKKNLENYKKMLEFCEDLISYKDPISNIRASSTYNLWLKDLIPPSFVKIINSDETMISDKNLIDELLKKWACLAVELEYDYVKIKDSTYSKEEVRASIMFNDTYFECLLKADKKDKALEVIRNGGVSYSCIEKNLLKILLSNQTENYRDILDKIAKNRKFSNDVLISYICLINNKQYIPVVDIDAMDKLTYITNEISLKVVLLSIIIGYQQIDKDIAIGMSLINNMINKIEKKDEDYQYLKILVRHGFLIGRTIRESNEGINTYNSDLLLKSYREFFSFNTKRVRTFYFSEGFEILLFMSLNQKDLLKQIVNENLYSLLELHLFERNLLGMYYKTIILDFLIKNGKNDIVKEYLLELYGENGEKLFLESNYEETHKCFKKYGEVVLPELTWAIDEKLQWDIVSYVNHKEYALWPLLKYFKKMIKRSPHEWKTRGLELYKLSSIADIKGSNRTSYDIQKEIATAAVNNGIPDIWMLRQHDEEFRFSLDLLYNQLFDLAETATDIEEILSVWILSCGILSWYNNEDRIGFKKIYYKCISKAKAFENNQIENLLTNLSPEHVKIATYQENESDEQQNKNDYSQKKEQEEIELKLSLSEMSTRDIIEFLKFEKHSLMRWSSVNIAWNLIENRGEISKNIAEEFAKITLSRLENYSWENSGCKNIVEKILDIFKNDFLWNLAEYNIKNLSNDDNYYTCRSNMEFLLQYAVDLLPIDVLKYIFDEELKCHYMWLTGYGHLRINFEITPSTSYLPVPKDMKELVCNILMEQILTRNIHRIEICLHGLQLLVERYPEIFTFLADTWELYSKEQKEYLIKLSERWSQENIEGFNTIYPCIEKEYEYTNKLDKKIQLYSILKIYKSILDDNKEMEIRYTAKEINYTLPYRYPSIFSKSNISNTAEKFLKIMENLTWDSNNDIRYFIQNEKIMTENTKLKNTYRSGDSTLYPNSYADLDMKILYGEEKKNRWEYIPISIKAQALLNIDDACIITKIPKITYEKEWYIENELKTYLKENSLVKCKPYLKRILEKDVHENMYIIGGVVWYPIGNKDGVIYTKTAKYIKNTILFKDLSITRSLNPGRIVSNLLKKDEELLEIEEEYVENNGVCLTNEIVGTGVFIYGNTMVYPSSLIKELLKIYPSKDNPLVWVKHENDNVMYFERFACPNREAIQESYFRQPLMCRWVCDKKEIDNIASKEGLICYKVNSIEKMPNLG